MAAYGPNGQNGVPFTGFSPTLGSGDAITPTTTANVQLNGLSQQDDRLSKLLRARGNRTVRRLLQTLIGVAPGVTATETFARVAQTQPAYVTPLGGLVPVETVASINRPTTATDVSNLVQSVTRSSALTYPTDVSGNGGGSKLYNAATVGMVFTLGGSVLLIGGTAITF